MKTIEIEDHDFEYLKSLAVPFEDTPSTTISRIFSEHQCLKGKTQPLDQDIALSTSERAAFRMDNLPNVSFTKVVSATISGKPCRALYWNDILHELIEVAGEQANNEKIKKELTLQMKDGQFTENGYRFVESVDLSFQGVDAPRACKNIARLAAAFNLPVKIVVKWEDKPKAQFPGKEGSLLFP